MIVDVTLNNNLHVIGTLVNNDSKGVVIRQSSQWLAYDQVRFLPATSVRSIQVVPSCRGLSKKVLEELE